MVQQGNGHRLFAAEVRRPSEDSSLLVLCARCGAWAETGRSKALAESCYGAPRSKHAAAALQRVRRGEFPKPGKLAQACTVAQLLPLAEVLGEVLGAED